MAEFAYNNAKNTSTNHKPFKLNCGYYPQVFFKYNINLCFKFYFTNKLVKELRKLIDIYQQNLFYTQELQKKHMIKA